MAGIAAKLAKDREAADGLGSHERAVKYLNQDYEELRNQCLEAGVLFQDPSFPAIASSLGFKELGPHSSKTQGIEWKRPTVGSAGGKRGKEGAGSAARVPGRRAGKSRAARGRGRGGSACTAAPEPQPAAQRPRASPRLPSPLPGAGARRRSRTWVARVHPRRSAGRCPQIPLAGPSGDFTKTRVTEGSLGGTSVAAPWGAGGRWGEGGEGRTLGGHLGQEKSVRNLGAAGCREGHVRSLALW